MAKFLIMIMMIALTASVTAYACGGGNNNWWKLESHQCIFSNCGGLNDMCEMDSCYSSGCVWGYLDSCVDLSYCGVYHGCWGDIRV